MCGILFSLTPKARHSSSEAGSAAASMSCCSEAMKADMGRQVLRRGPDASGALGADLADEGGHGARLELLSSVLSVRGSGADSRGLDDAVAPQPYVSEHVVFAWNGELYAGIGGAPDAQVDILQGSDTQALEAALEGVVRSDTLDLSAPLLALLGRQVRGPWSLVLWDRKRKHVWFGRDVFGRRSLCWTEHSWTSLLAGPRVPIHAGLLLSSTTGVQLLPGRQAAPEPVMNEVDVLGLYRLDLAAWLRHESGCLQLFPWPLHSVRYKDISDPVEAMSLFGAYLSRSVRRRVLTIDHRHLSPPPFMHLDPSVKATNACLSILFSGGLDCTVLAALVSDILAAEKSLKLPCSEPIVIDLLNVAFFRDDCQAGDNEADNENSKERQRRPRKGTGTAKRPGIPPDRVTAIESFQLLRDRCEWLRSCADGRQRRPIQFQLILVDVSRPAYLEAIPNLVNLMWPQNTVMDLSIAAPFWFAAKGLGYLHAKSAGVSADAAVWSSSKVYLSGLGADELLGGYARHRRCFEQGGSLALEAELNMDWERLWKRNLGRDDRIIADQAREIRTSSQRAIWRRSLSSTQLSLTICMAHLIGYPFLDEDFVDLVRHGMSAQDKMNFELERGLGEKHILRRFAQSLLPSAGVDEPDSPFADLQERWKRMTMLPKRAIQFGARTAHFVQLSKKGDPANTDPQDAVAHESGADAICPERLAQLLADLPLRP